MTKEPFPDEFASVSFPMDSIHPTRLWSAFGIIGGISIADIKWCVHEEFSHCHAGAVVRIGVGTVVSDGIIVGGDIVYVFSSARHRAPAGHWAFHCFVIPYTGLFQVLLAVSLMGSTCSWQAKWTASLHNHPHSKRRTAIVIHFIAETPVFHERVLIAMGFPEMAY